MIRSSAVSTLAHGTHFSENVEYRHRADLVFEQCNCLFADTVKQLHFARQASDIYIESPRDLVARSAVERAGLSSLNEGAKVSYEEINNRGKTAAENLRVA